MGWVFDSLGEAFTKSLDLKGLWKYYLVIAILAGLVAFAIELGILWLPILSYLDLTFVQFFTSPQTVMLALMLAFLTGLQSAGVQSIITLLAAVTIIYTLVSTLWEAIIIGFNLNIAKDYLSKAKPSLGSAWDKTKPRFITLFIINVVVGILLLILLLLLLAPAILSLLNNLPSILESLPGIVYSSMMGNEAAVTAAATAIASLLVGTMLMAMIGVFLFTVILFFLMPILAMVAPVVLFEKAGVIGSLKRIVEVGKREYLATLGYLILAGIIIVAATIIYMVVVMSIAFFGGLLSAIGAPFAGIVAGIIIFIVLAVYIIWAMAFSSLALTKLYQAKAGTRAASSTAGKPARKLAKSRK